MTITDPLAALVDQLDADRQPSGPANEPPGPDAAEQVEQYLHPNWRSRPHIVDLSATPAAGAWVWNGERSDFPIRAVRVDNLSGYRFVFSRRAPVYLPAYRLGFVALLGGVERSRDLMVDQAGPVGALVISTFEAALPPTDGVDLSPGESAGWAGVDGSTAIAVGGTAQTLFGGATPAHGYWVMNPDLTEDLWLSDTTTAAPNGQGSQRVAADGGDVWTPERYRPVGPVSIVGATGGHKITARMW